VSSAVEKDPQPVGLARRGHPREQGLLGLAVGPVVLGQHVGSAALIHVDVTGDLGDLGHELDGAGPGPDHRDPSARQVDIVVPAGGVPHRPGELLPAGDGGQHGPAELPDGAHDRAGLQRAAVVEGEVPDRAALVEPRRRHPASQPKVRAEPVLGHQTVQVTQDLFARGEAPAPAPRPERERVQLRRHVTGQPRIAVVTPDPADVIGPVQHHEVVDARPPQRDRHADPAEPRADHYHPVCHEHPSLRAWHRAAPARLP
jgi:hypothetical protein